MFRVRLNERKLNNKTLHFQLNDFVNKFETEGPGVEDDMDRGQKLMEMYAVEFEKFEVIRAEMGKRTRKQFLFKLVIFLPASMSIPPRSCCAFCTLLLAFVCPTT